MVSTFCLKVMLLASMTQVARCPQVHGGVGVGFAVICAGCPAWCSPVMGAVCVGFGFRRTGCTVAGWPPWSRCPVPVAPCPLVPGAVSVGFGFNDPVCAVGGALIARMSLWLRVPLMPKPWCPLTAQMYVWYRPWSIFCW